MSTTSPQNTKRSLARRFADLVIRRRWVVVGVWVVVAGAMFVWVKPPRGGAGEKASFLPRTMPSRQAAEALGEYFPHTSGLSETVTVFERSDGPLTDADRKAIQAVCEDMRRPHPPRTKPKDLVGVYVRSPFAMPGSPMVSPLSTGGQAALIVANIPSNFITKRAVRIVRHARAVVDRHRKEFPAGLKVAVTGSAAFGHDYAEAADRSHDRTLWVTLTAVVLILLIVYRAPIAGVIPLAAISLAAVAALSLMALGCYVGLITGTAEQIFVVVLLYGAGIDYSLLLISRCREFFDDHRDMDRAMAEGLEASLPAVLASAGTDTAGLLMLSFSRYSIFQTTGISVGVALLVALAAAVTLVPALVSIAGGKLFWPGWKAARPRRRSRLWMRIARLVTDKAGAVMAVTLALLAVPAVRGANLTWVYDTVSDLSEGYDSVRGTEMVRRHWPVGELNPVNVLLLAEKPLTPETWERLDRRIAARLQRLDGVYNVRSLSAPFGSNNGNHAAATQPNGQAGQVARRIGALLLRPLRGFMEQGRKAVRQGVRKEYISDDDRGCRLAVIMVEPGLTLRAMAIVDQVRRSIHTVLESANLRDAAGKPVAQPKVYLGGVTAEKIDVREVTHGDFLRIASLVLVVIFLMVLLLLRDVLLSGFMILSTIVSYLATLGIVYWVFRAVDGVEGLDWKVEVFLFVVMVAVGQDYNIFLAARLAQEGRSYSPVEATRRAVIHTGPVISSCGVIMAATLGSLMASVDLRLLVQLGFALSLGMLIDTFVVRPLLLPSFAVLTRRTGRSFRRRS